MKANGLGMFKVGMVLKFGLMERDMKATIWMERNMVMEFINGSIIQNIEENGKIIK